VDLIVQGFRGGNYDRLQEVYGADAVITALSSSLAVMRSLFVIPSGVDTVVSLVAQEGGEDEEAKEEEEEEEDEEAAGGGAS
jgi:hypothetical protein